MLTPSEKSLSFLSMSSWLRPYLVSCQLFTSVFGVGPKTAEKWYRRGLRSFSDILADPSIQLNRMQQNGTSTSHHLHSATPQIIDWKFQLEFASKKESKTSSLNFSREACMSFGISCPFWSHRNLLMLDFVCNVFSLKWDDMWPAGSLQGKHNGKGSRGIFNKNQWIVTAERLLWNSHELSSISWADRAIKAKTMRGCWLTVGELWFIYWYMLVVFGLIFLWGIALQCFCNIIIQFNYRLILDGGVWTVSRAVFI